MTSRWRFPLGFAAAVVTFMIVTDLLLVPWHERSGGDLTSRLIGLNRLLQLPGLIIAESTGARFQRHTGWGAWVVILLVSFPLFTWLGAIGRWMCWPCKARTSRTSPVRNEASSAASGSNAPDGENDAAGDSSRSNEPTSGTALMSRRRLLLMTRQAAFAGAVGTAGYAFLGELRDVEVTRQRATIPNLPPALRGLRIAHLTDIHHGPWTSLSFIRQVVEETNGLNPDLIVLTGDFIHSSSVYIEPVVAEMAKLRAKVGVVGTLGNHDWWEDGRAMLRAFARTPIRMIDNDRLYVTSDRTLENSVGQSDARHALCLGGVGDLWEDPPMYDRALGGIPASMPRILLSHNPDVVEERPLLAMADRIGRIDLTLAGHTHGGQISLPFVGTLVTPSKYGNRYAVGLVQGPLGPVYVNRGVGTTIMPIRLGVRPEIAVIELV